MSTIWDARTYDAARRRLVPCFDQSYGTVVELVAYTTPSHARILDLGAGTGLLSGMLAERLFQWFRFAVYAAWKPVTE